VLFVIHYNFDLRFDIDDVDTAFVLGSFCLGLEGCCLVNTGQHTVSVAERQLWC